MELNEIESHILQQWDGVPAAEISVSILEYLAQVPAEELSVITFRMLVRAAGQEALSADLLAAVNILSGGLSLLDAHAFFVDENDEEHELDDEEFAYARRTNQVVHPITGELVDNASQHLVPFFVPTESFYKALK